MRNLALAMVGLLGFAGFCLCTIVSWASIESCKDDGSAADIAWLLSAGAMSIVIPLAIADTRWSKP